jgi:exopolyphosphatase / guanosine-5'-triphosphate,3'-diphosphate pyrophosphatase
MAEIVPRWEWRTFTAGESVVRQFSALTAERMQNSHEVYLLSPVNDANVKIRDALMDIKTLEQVGPTGLERWRPVMKATIPLDGRAVREVYAALGLPAPAEVREATTLEDLSADLQAQRVRAVDVHKLRLRYAFDGTMAEMTEVAAGDRRTRTIAVESEDAARVDAIRRRFGLSDLANESYPRGLKSLIGMPLVGA